MKKLITTMLQTNEQIIKHEEIEAKIGENKIFFQEDEINVAISLENDIITVNRETNEHVTSFEFKKDEETVMVIRLKSSDYSITGEVITKELYYNEKEIVINYELTMGSEQMGNFSYKIDIMGE